MPPGRLADLHVDLATLWGSEGASLRERLCDAKSSDDRFRILQSVLVSRLSKSRQRHRAVQPALELLRRNSTPIGEIGARLGLSHRRFIEVFNAEVGVTPKLFSRVQRFQSAMRLAQCREAIDGLISLPRAGTPISHISSAISSPSPVSHPRSSFVAAATA